MAMKPQHKALLIGIAKGAFHGLLIAVAITAVIGAAAVIGGFGVYGASTAASFAATNFLGKALMAFTGAGQAILGGIGSLGLNLGFGSAALAAGTAAIGATYRGGTDFFDAQDIENRKQKMTQQAKKTEILIKKELASKTRASFRAPNIDKKHDHKISPPPKASSSKNSNYWRDRKKSEPQQKEHALE